MDGSNNKITVGSSSIGFGCALAICISWTS